MTSLKIDKVTTIKIAYIQISIAYTQYIQQIKEKTSLEKIQKER